MWFKRADNLQSHIVQPPLKAWKTVVNGIELFPYAQCWQTCKNWKWSCGKKMEENLYGSRAKRTCSRVSSNDCTITSPSFALSHSIVKWMQLRIQSGWLNQRISNFLLQFDVKVMTLLYLCFFSGWLTCNYSSNTWTYIFFLKVAGKVYDRIFEQRSGRLQIQSKYTRWEWIT